MKKVFCMILSAVLALSCVSALAEDTIKIGGIAPLTGAVSVYGNLVKDGVDLYIDEVNANGGVLGKKVEMIWKDDTGDAVEATNAYEQLVSEGVAAPIGPVTTTPTLAVAQRAAADRCGQSEDRHAEDVHVLFQRDHRARNGKGDRADQLENENRDLHKSLRL